MAFLGPVPVVVLRKRWFLWSFHVYSDMIMLEDCVISGCSCWIQAAPPAASTRRQRSLVIHAHEP